MKRYAVAHREVPRIAHVNLARLGLGMAQYRKGELDAAQKTLEAIPAADRTGDLAVVSYNLADLYLRQAPAKADDAVAAGKLEEKVKGAADLLEAFLASAPDSPQPPDALLKLGYCRQRLAKILVAARRPAEGARPTRGRPTSRSSRSTPRTPPSRRRPSSGPRCWPSRRTSTAR